MSRRRHDCGIAECAALPLSGQEWALARIPGAGHAYRERERAIWWIYYASLATGRARIRRRRILRAQMWLEHAENRMRRLQALARRAP